MKKRLKPTKMWAIVTRTTQTLAVDNMRGNPCLYFTRERAERNRISENRESIIKVEVRERQ
jgi:hypothetical protein